MITCTTGISNYTSKLIRHWSNQVHNYLCLSRVDPDSPLASDMKKLKEKEGQDYILLHMSFESTFPYTPPFLRVVKPYMAGG